MKVSEASLVYITGLKLARDKWDLILEMQKSKALLGPLNKGSL